MSGPKPSYPISLTEAEEKRLQQVVRAHKSGKPPSHASTDPVKCP